MRHTHTRLMKNISSQNILIILSILAGILIMVAVWVTQRHISFQGTQESPRPEYVGPADAAHTVSFGKAFISAKDQWSMYTNPMFGFSMDLPPKMETHHVANVLKLNEKEYIQYVVEFIGSTHSASDQRHIGIAIQETSFTSVKEYLQTVSPLDAEFYEEKQSPSGISVIVIPHQNINNWKQQRIVRETDVFFIKNGHIFNLSFNLIEAGDFERIINSIVVAP